MTEQEFIDKWYKKYFKLHVLDTKAAEAMDVAFPEDTPKSLKDFNPPEASVDPDSVIIPRLDNSYKLGAHWNYPMLIEAFEKANNQSFNRADIRLILKTKNLKIDFNLKEILTNPTKTGHFYLRDIWLTDFNPFEILRYIGPNLNKKDYTELLDWLEGPKPDVQERNTPVNLTKAELTKQAMLGVFYE